MRQSERSVGRGGGASWLSLAVLIGVLLAWAPVEKLVVVRGDMTRTVALARDAGYPAAALPALADALGYAWMGNSLQLAGETVRFTSGSPFFSVGSDVFQLANPAYRQGGKLMVPAGWALDWLPDHQPRRWRYMDGRLVERPAAAERPPARDSWLVIIDPGHGGRDPGAIGVNGTREKDITLQIGERLAKKLEQERGIRAVLTRDRDTLVSLADRPRVPQLRGIDAPPDLFVSIHGNSMPKKPNAARGFETYFLSVAKSDKARQVAMRENASLQFESDTLIRHLEPLQFILSDLQSTANLRESSLLATAIDKSVRKRLNAPDQRVRQAGFYVLVGAAMPAALVEVGYLSNRAEEKLLRSPAYQAKIADALAEAVVSYLADYGRRVWSSQSSGR